MSTITSILEPDAEGTLHLPLPEELRQKAVRVKAELEPSTTAPTRAKAGLWEGLPYRFWMAADFDAPLEDFREYMECSCRFIIAILSTVSSSHKHKSRASQW